MQEILPIVSPLRTRTVFKERNDYSTKSLLYKQDAMEFECLASTKTVQLFTEETASIAYHDSKNNHSDSFIAIELCLYTETYCSNPAAICDHCTQKKFLHCRQKKNTQMLATMKVFPAFAQRFSSKKSTGDSLCDDILSFRHPHSFHKTIPICNKIRTLVNSILLQEKPGMLQEIFLQSVNLQILFHFMEKVGEMQYQPVFSCKFLANETDREKIFAARDILLENMTEPFTIKNLSRKAGINECYLKKGFKELFGTTIFEFYQQKRMEHAKYLLYEKGLNVTDVASILGYSSISHFSTAFKKQTGMKPCELLVYP